MNTDWKFHDDPNTACFTTTFVLDGSPIQRVYHDYEGDWQFHGSSDQPTADFDAKLVCLADMIRRDTSLNELHDLPYGWRAERSAPTDEWKCFKDNPFPSFSENGYYLEDAVWLSGYLPDINPPDASVREDLPNGEYAKLVFRFAAENFEREDNQCERIWVQVKDRDENGYYFGTIENDPHHDSAKYGDLVSFHPSHIADVNAD